MAEAGILGEDDRVELLEGQLIEMASIGPRHALAVDALNEMLVLAAVGQAVVRVQNRSCWTPRRNHGRISPCCGGGIVVNILAFARAGPDPALAAPTIAYCSVITLNRTGIA